MGNNSILVSKPNYFYQTTADEHLLICLPVKHEKPKSRANPFCMAKLISSITYWTDARRSQNEAKDLGVFFTLDQWHMLLRNEHSRQAIIDSLDALVQAGFLTLRKEFRVGGGKPHNIYYLQAEKINSLILALPDIDPFDIFPKVTIAANSKVTNGTTEGEDKVTNGTTDSNKWDYCKSQTGLLEVTNGTTNLNYKSITTNHVTTNQTKPDTVRANRATPAPAPASQKSLFSSEEETDQEQGKKRGRRSKKDKQGQEFKLPEFPDMDGPATVEIIMQLGAALRQRPYVKSNYQRSDYQRALQEGAGPLANKRRPAQKKTGYSLQEIASIWRFMIGETPEGKDWLKAEWWPEHSANVDLWAVAKHADVMLAKMEELERAHRSGAAARSGSAPAGAAAPAEQEEDKQEFDYSLVLWTRHPEDTACQQYMDREIHKTHQELKALRLEIRWEWMHFEEAKQYGWRTGFRLSDRNLRELINDLKRVKGIQLEHHIQNYINHDYEKPYVPAAS